MSASMHFFNKITIGEFWGINIHLVRIKQISECIRVSGLIAALGRIWLADMRANKLSQYFQFPHVHQVLDLRHEQWF